MDAARARDSLSIVLTGSGGAGVMTAGQTLLDAATSCGLYGLMTRSTGPQIRGGEAAAMIRLARRPVQCPGDRFDILLALDFDNVQRFAAELPLDRDSLIIADPAAGDLPEFLKLSGARVAHVTMAKLAKSVRGGRVSMVALGALARLIGLPETAIVEAVAAAQGLADDAAMDRITVTREIEGESVEIVVPLKQIMNGRAPNFALWPGDIVHVPSFRILP